MILFVCTELSNTIDKCSFINGLNFQRYGLSAQKVYPKQNIHIYMGEKKKSRSSLACTYFLYSLIHNHPFLIRFLIH